MKIRIMSVFGTLVVLSAALTSTASAGGIGLTYVYAGENDEKSNIESNIEKDNSTSTINRNDDNNDNNNDREVGIGQEVREIANKQENSATTTNIAMLEIGKRGPVKELFFGGDYKNLGIIRSELATTTNSIAKLKSLVEKTTDITEKAELNAQIQVLESEQTKIKAYLKEHEDIFSFFGWFVKLFS